MYTKQIKERNKKNIMFTVINIIGAINAALHLTSMYNTAVRNFLKIGEL